jgi:uncharacterized membrane protein YfcA
MGAKTALLAALALLGVIFVVRWAALERLRRAEPPSRSPSPRSPTPVGLAIGFVTDFLDTLGVGSYAVTTSLFKVTRSVDDRDIPGTLNVGHTLPTLAEAFIYIVVVKVEMLTLVALVSGAVVGAWLGAGVVTRLPKRQIQRAMGVLLVVAAGVIVLRQANVLPASEGALGLQGSRLLLGVLGNGLLGALMMLGIGLYAPCMILVSLLGMNVAAAFPIMMGSCAFLMPIASLRFVAARRYDVRAALGLALGGIPGVLIAAFIVGSLNLATLQWLVVIVVLVTALAMLRSSARRGLTQELS